MDMLKDERFDFTILENDIVRDTKKYNKNELLAYIAISYHADKAGTCFPSYEGIAKIMRASRTTAINAIQGLVEKGVIKLENRKADEKKNEMTSNLYTLVSNKFWEQAKQENKIYLIKKGVDYKKRYAKGKATKIANKNAKLKEQKDKKNTPDSLADETDVLESSLKNFNDSIDKSIIPQDNVDCPQESHDKNGQNMSKRLKDRMELLNNAGIKYVPHKSDKGVIESMDIGILKQAIDITVEQSISKSWKYLVTTYDSISRRMNQENKKYKSEVRNTFKPSYSGGIGLAKSNLGGKYFEDWSADEINEMCRLANGR